MKRVFALLLILLCLTGCAPAQQTVTADTPVPGEDPFGNTYYYRAAVKFDGYIGSGYVDYGKYLAMSFDVTADGHFWVDGTDMGTLKETVLTEENFDSVLAPRKNEQYYVDLAASLRTENERAWAVGEDFLLLRQNSGALLLVDRYSIFDMQEKPVRVLRLGKTPLGTNGKTRWYGIEGAAAVETSTKLTDGSAYIATECLSGDQNKLPSRYYYYIDGDEFVPVLYWWNEERGRAVFSRQWQPLPWTEEEWLKQDYVKNALGNIAPYESWQCIPLKGKDCLLTAEGSLFLWNSDGLYRLEQMDSHAAAKWTYAERLDTDHLPLELVVEGDHEDYRRLWLDCENGLLACVMVNQYTGQRFLFPEERNVLYWSPMNDDGSRAEEVTLELAFLRGDDRMAASLDEDDIFLRMTVTAKLNGTQYKDVRIEADGDLPEGIAVSVLDWEGRTLCRKAG